MNMKRYLKLAVTAGLAVGVVACDDDFLTTLPQDVVSDAVYWQTERDFTLAINAVYRNVLDNQIFYMEGATDLSYSGKDWTPNHAVAQGHNDASTGFTNGIWNTLYQGISRANEVLNRLETSDAPLSATFRTQTEAQARFLRGYFYHELLWLYGGVPLFESVPTVTEAREVGRNSRDEVINFVLTDLTVAAAGLPDSWPAAQSGRATRGAALAFIARAALYEASYNKYHEGNASRANQLFQVAAEAAQDVIGSGVYNLIPNFRDLHTYAGQGSAEVIFDYQRIQGVNGWPAWSWLAPHSMGGNIDLTPTRAIVDAFRMIDGLSIHESPMYDPTPPVISAGQTQSLGMYANRDPRLYATVLFPGAEFEGQVFNSFPNSPTPDRLVFSNFSNTHTGYVWLKYVDPQDRPNPSNSGINQIRMRFADVLLMYAEAKVELNQIDASVETAFNRVRTRAGMPGITLGSQEQMIELIRNERVVELGGEGLRLADIRRWKIAEHVMPWDVPGIDIVENGQIVTLAGLWQRSFPAPRNYLWPIPVTERDLNPNLAQNPGF
jgi:starch-binding outer membrane protein, SusD/RagB family